MLVQQTVYFKLSHRISLICQGHLLLARVVGLYQYLSVLVRLLSQNVYQHITIAVLVYFSVAHDGSAHINYCSCGSTAH